MDRPEPTAADRPHRVRSWIAALRAGSTTPWEEWSDATSTASASLRFVPGAQQLELLRRLNVVAAAAGGRVPESLSDRVLLAGSTDRGRGDLPLRGPGAPRFGPPAVDPAGLPAADLLKVAAGLIAENLRGRPIETPRGGRRPRIRFRRRRPPLITGDPWAVLHAEASLRRARVAMHGPRTLVLAADLATMAVHAWAARAVDGGGVGLQGWLNERVTAHRLPLSLDVLAMARETAGRVGAAATVVVLDATLLPPQQQPPAPPGIDVDAVDLARRVGRPLGLLVSPEQRRALLAGVLLPRLRVAGDPAPALGVPPPWSEHLVGHADRMRERLRREDYPVVGSLDRLVPDPASALARQPSDERVLGLAIDVLLGTRGGAA